MHADILVFEDFSGFPDTYGGPDGVEDWGFEGWVEFNHEGPVTSPNQFIDWNVEYYSPWASFELTPGNSFVSVADRSGANFNVSGGRLTKPLGSNDAFEFILSSDTARLVHFGHTLGGDPYDILLQDRNLDLGGNVTNVHLIRDPPTDLFASVIPEPACGLPACIIALIFVCRRRRLV